MKDDLRRLFGEITISLGPLDPYLRPLILIGLGIVLFVVAVICVVQLVGSLKDYYRAKQSHRAGEMGDAVSSSAVAAGALVATVALPTIAVVLLDLI